MTFEKGNKVNLGRKRGHPWNYLGHLSEETKSKISKGKLGRPSWNKGLTTRKEEYFIPRTTLSKKTVKKSHLIWCKSNKVHRIPSKCVIHHLNLNPRDNRIENLQLMDLGTHSSLHHQISKLLRIISKGGD